MKIKSCAMLTLSAGVGLMFLSASAWAGVYFESEIHSSIDPEIQKTQTYISGAKMKALINGTHGYLIDLKVGKLWDFDLENKTYYTISLDQMGKEFNSIGSKMKIFSEMSTPPTAAEKELAKDLADDPDEINQFGDSTLPLGKEMENNFEPVLKKVKKKSKILGYDCYLVQVDLSSSERQEFWVTNQIPFTQEVLNFWKAFYRFSSQPINQFDPLKKHFDVMARLDGFVLYRKLRIQSGGGSPFEEVEAVRLVEDRRMDDDVFDLPKDLKAIELFQAESQRKDLPA